LILPWENQPCKGRKFRREFPNMTKKLQRIPEMVREVGGEDSVHFCDKAL
jgi:hypothetical protein